MIKAMLDRGMKNKDIQFYFNRPERSVNSGRISTIRTGAYSNSGKILAASSDELDRFLERFASQERNQSSPSDDHDVRKFFRRESDSLWYLHRGESEECECKQDFDPKKLTPVVRAIAALANNRGGYIFFGVGNNQCRVDGAARAISKEISAGKLRVPRAREDVAPFAYGLTAVTAMKVPLQDVLNALQVGRELAERAGDKNALGAVCKAVCRVDELFFGNETLGPATERAASGE
ncbi:succinate dehydrogenase flavin-adding protein (antitoxin of CptAB toxin-antitoxin module) [Bradyrhizobium sp. JR6.1]